MLWIGQYLFWGETDAGSLSDIRGVGTVGLVAAIGLRPPSSPEGRDRSGRAVGFAVELALLQTSPRRSKSSLRPRGTGAMTCLRTPGAPAATRTPMTLGIGLVARLVLQWSLRSFRQALGELELLAAAGDAFYQGLRPRRPV